MQPDIEIPTHLNMRLDPKVRYLADLAARSRKLNLTDYIEDAIIESFKRFTLRKPSEPEPMYVGKAGKLHIDPIDAEQERMKDEAMMVSNIANDVWSENPFVRLQIRALSLPHLMTIDDKQLLSYIHTREDLKIKNENGYKFNREVIADNWEEIKAAAEKAAKKGGK